MRLRRPCEHGRYDAHYIVGSSTASSIGRTCAGGEFLADDTLVVEKVDGEWPGRASQIIVDLISEGDTEPYLAVMLSVGILDALAVREGEG